MQKVFAKKTQKQGVTTPLLITDIGWEGEWVVHIYIYIYIYNKFVFLFICPFLD
jgi:hypothetical protein